MAAVPEFAGRDILITTEEPGEMIFVAQPTAGGDFFEREIRGEQEIAGGFDANEPEIFHRRAAGQGAVAADEMEFAQCADERLRERGGDEPVGRRIAFAFGVQPMRELPDSAFGIGNSQGRPSWQFLPTHTQKGGSHRVVGISPFRVWCFLGKPQHIAAGYVVSDPSSSAVCLPDSITMISASISPSRI